MKAKLVWIGNSRGIRLSKSLIEQAGLGDEVELNVRGDEVVIRAKSDPREGWEEACRRMRECGDDQLLDAQLPSLTKFDEEEWEW